MGCLVRITEKRRPWGLAGRVEVERGRQGVRESDRRARGFFPKGACAFPWAPCLYAPSSTKKGVYIPFQRTGSPFSHSISFCHRSFSAPCCPLGVPLPGILCPSLSPSLFSSRSSSRTRVYAYLVRAPRRRCRDPDTISARPVVLLLLLTPDQFCHHRGTLNA